MNPWKISTFVLGLAVVGLLGLSATNSGGESLQGSFGSGGGSAHGDIMTAVTEVHDELGYSSWTLEGLAEDDYRNYASTIDFMAEHIGTSTWTLDTLAEQMYDVCN